MKSEFISAAPNRGKSVAKRDRLWKSKKQECESNECGRFIPEEAYNCVNNCTSNVCYQEIYALEPLEDGEIDHERNGKFVACVRKEYSNVDKSDMVKSLFLQLRILNELIIFFFRKKFIVKVL